MKFILLLLVLIPFTSESAEINREQAASIYVLAHSISGYKIPPKPPEINLVSIEKLRSIACPGKECPVHALQVREKIYLDESLDMSDIQNAAILLHELVHFLQYANKGEAVDCEDWLQREFEAYGLQNHVLEKAGARRIRMPALACL